MNSGYELKHTAKFDRKAAKVAGTIERWDDIARSYDYGLSRSPHKGFQITDTSLWVTELRVDGRPTMLYYTIDEDSRTIILVDIHSLTF
jgi:hypothetical protein